MHARILYSFVTLICWLWWLICLDWGFRDNYFFCTSLLYLFGILICWLYRLLILFRLAYWFWFFPWLFWSPCMYGFIVVYHLIWHVNSLAYILSWSSLSMMSVSLFILIVIAYMCTWVIYLCFAWLYVAWLPSFYVIACRLFVWVTHLSPYLQPSSFGHFFHSDSQFCKCEALCVLILWPN